MDHTGVLRPAVVLVTFLVGPAAWAATPSPTPIQFARGTTEATVDGAIARGETARYRFGAGADQWLDIAVRSVEENAVVQIYLPGWRLAAEDGIEVVRGEALPGGAEGEDARRWAGLLPTRGEYLVVVGATRGGAEYDLTVAIRDPTEADCEELPQQSMNACLGAVVRSIDTRRTRLAVELGKLLEPRRRDLLVDAELAWKAYRDGHCRFVAAPYEGGTIAPAIYGDCAAALARARIAELEELLASERDE